MSKFLLTLLTPHSVADVTTNSSSEMFPVAPGTVGEAELADLVRALYPVWQASGGDKYEAHHGWTADELVRAFSFSYITEESAKDYLEDWDEEWGQGNSEARKAAAEDAFHQAMDMDDTLASKLLQHAAIRESMSVDAKEAARALLVPGTPYIYCSDDETPISFFHLLHSVLGGHVFVNR